MAGLTYSKYYLLSFLGGVAVVYHAFATRQHFYPAMVYLSTSKLAVALLGNMAFASALLGQSLAIKLFLGGLREIEVEMVRERLSSAIMESLLALTVFRDEFGTFFVAMFATLAFVKVLHWLVQDRVDYILHRGLPFSDRPSAPPHCLLLAAAAGRGCLAGAVHHRGLHQE